MLISDDEVKAMCEVKAPEYTICEKCEHCIRYTQVFLANTPVGIGHRCRAVRVQYVNDSPSNFKACEEVNGGKCPYYKQKEVVVKEVDIRKERLAPTFLQKLKKIFS